MNEAAALSCGLQALGRVDRSDPAVAKGAALLFSGGSDSTLAACRLAEVFPVVHLNTFDRPGFLATRSFPASRMERLSARFPQSRLVHRVIDAGGFYHEVESWGGGRALKDYGWLALDTCGHCKAALHWRNLVFCIDNGIRYAADGAVTGAEQFAEQNPRILMPQLAALYARFGVTLLRPCYESGLSVEDELFELGVTDARKIKLTSKDLQVVCTQQILFAMMMRLYLRGRSFERYEKEASAYLAWKLEHVGRATEEYASGRRDGLVGRLLGA